jgi:hypothetical protein
LIGAFELDYKIANKYHKVINELEPEAYVPLSLSPVIHPPAFTAGFVAIAHKIE